MMPDSTESRTIDDGVLVPLGKPTKQESSKTVRELLRSNFTNCIDFQMHVPCGAENTLFATCEKKHCCLVAGLLALQRVHSV